MSETTTPSRVLAFLTKRHEQPETVCLINNHYDNRVAWLAEFVDLLGEALCEQYSVNRRELEARIRWKHDGPEHVVSLFESHEEACKKAYSSVCRASPGGEASMTTPTPSQPPLSAGAVPELPVAGYRINTGHGNHLTEVLDEARRSFMWAGKPAWRELTYRDTAQAIIDAQAAEIEHHKQVAEAWKISYLQIRSEIIALKAAQVAEVDAVLQAGNPMSNVMFNLAQRPNERITSAECKTFKKLQVKWDAASEALRAALTKDRT